MDEKKIVIALRDLNGKRYSLQFDNVVALQNFDWEELGENYEEDYEILLVIWGEHCIYSGLGNAEGLYFDDLIGFFA